MDDIKLKALAKKGIDDAAAAADAAGSAQSGIDTLTGEVETARSGEASLDARIDAVDGRIDTAAIDGGAY